MMPVRRAGSLALSISFLLASLHSPSAVAAEQGAPASDATPSGLLGEVWRLRDARDFQSALARVEDGLVRYPDDPGLYRLQALLLADLGASYRAWALYRARPGLFEQDQAQLIEQNYLARLISWGGLYPADPSTPRQESEQAARAVEEYLATKPASTRLRADRLQLLNQLGHYQRLVDEYEAMRAEGIDVPGYAMAPVGDAYMALRRPEEAEAALSKAIASDPGNVDLKVQHAYALLEMERFDLALPEFAALTAANPAFARAASGATYPNWNRYTAETNDAMARSYGEDLAGAQAMLEPMAATGPANPGLHNALGSVYGRRGWRERALERYRMAQTLAPRDIAADIGQVDTLIALQRTDQARPIHDELVATHPDALQVRRMDALWKVHQGWQVAADAGFGRNRGNGTSAVSPAGNREGDYAVVAASPLIDDRWRVVAGVRDRYADFQGDRIHDRRLMAGMQYAYDRLYWRAYADRSFDDLDTTGLGLDARWRFSDVLDGNLALHSNDPDASLQARRVGIGADSARIGLDWHPSELTSVTGGLEHWRYEDGNRRLALSASLDQRLVTRPHFFLNGLASVYTSRGSRDDAPYFNPSRDGSWNIGLRADHLAWRRYDRHFRHRLTVQAGQYWQEGYGSAWVPSLRYEHEWKLGIGKVIGYGATWSRPVYDGQRESHVGFDAFLRWGD